MSNQAFLGELDRIFKEDFLEAAPLYVASSKIKLPYEDLHRLTPMYSGALKEVLRPVQQIVDYESFKKDPEPEEIIELATRFGQEAGHLVNGLIRMENVRSLSEGTVGDPRDTRNMKVIDIFEHSDGRRNLQVFFYQENRATIHNPTAETTAWFGYKFVFACAAIVLEYKKRA